ncbi:MAG: HAMP domain-containing histidine kinase [Eubacterium sp.]|nr:HAMP domain-containing histidine kinase [Eubacterium sp.]
MKFRYKVLLINIILISIALSISGFLMMSRQNKIMVESQVKNAVTENNLVQSVMEYSLLDTINNKPDFLDSAIPDISLQITSGILNDTTQLYVKYNDKILYQSDEKSTLPEELTNSSQAAYKKKYLLANEKNKDYIYVISTSVIDENIMNIITKRDITDSALTRKKSLRDFRTFFVLILILTGLFVYIISMLLTRPLEKLNSVTDEFSEGNFEIRSDLNAHDEIGLLSDKFNHMADSVEGHIDELNDMIHKRDQFVADFTHEIKTPMTTIIGYADTIRSVDLPREDEIKAANYIFSEGRRLEQMSSHLFDLIYLKDGDIAKQEINTQGLGEAVIETVRPALEKAELSLKYDFENASITGDAPLLKTAFINLLDNARKASSKGSEISFSGRITKEEDDVKSPLKYEYTVEDHGIGISEEDIDRICDEFYMVDKSRSRKEGGAGLGMSLVSAILKEHSADLKIESKVGEGTKMIITIACKEIEEDDE